MSSQPESTKNLGKDGDDEDENGADNSKNGNFGGDLLICISCGMRYSSVDNLIQHILGSHQVNLVTAESLLSYAFQDGCSASARIQAVLQLHKTYERHSYSVENKAKDMDLISGAVVSILRSATTNAEKPSESSALKLGNKDKNTEEEDPGKDLEEGGDLVMCISCGIGYSSVDNLIQHILGSHSGNPVTAESLLHYGFQDGSSDAKIQAVLKLRKSLRNKDKNTEEEVPEKDREEVLREEQYICEYCNKAFSCRKNFRHHLLNHHRFTKEYTEVVISTILERENERKLSPKSKSLPRTKPTTSKVTKNVINRRRTKGKVTRKFLNRKYRNAKPTSNGKKNSMNKIKTNSRTPFRLPDHVIEIDEKCKKFQCTFCLEKPFKTKMHAKYHMYCAMRPEERPLQCETCGKRIITKSHLVYHELLHSGKRPYACLTCPMRFIQKCKLTRHLRSHTGEKPYICKICKKGFASSQALQSHASIHTGERNFPCTTCDKKFRNSANLRRHRNIHSENRPFACTECTKRFIYKCTLDQHMKTHSNEPRSFACNRCPLAFFHKKDLTRHERTHTGERPYICTSCSVSSPRVDNLRRHIRKIHKPTEEVVERMLREAITNYKRKLAMNKKQPLETATNSSSILIDNNAEPSSSGSTSENRCEPIVQPVTNISTDKKLESVTIPGPSSASCRRSTRLRQKKQAEGNNSSKCEQAGVLAISTGGLENTSPNRVENAVSFSPTVVDENSVNPGLIGSRHETQHDNQDLVQIVRQEEEMTGTTLVPNIQ